MQQFNLSLLSVAAALCLAPPLMADDQAKDDYRARIFLANADGSGWKPLVDLPEYKGQGSPTFSQDGKWIAFDAWRPQLGEKIQDAKVILVNADGSNPRVLGDGAMPSFSPRANRIAYSRYHANQGVWIMNSSRPDKENILVDADGWGAKWSPDGTRIVYSKHEGRQANLIIYNLIEGTREPLMDGSRSRYNYIYWNFAWSPDSRHIAFKGQGENGQDEVGIVDARGEKHGLITRFVGDVRPCFAYSPDGRLLFSYKKPVAGSLLQLYEVDPKGNQPPELYSHQSAKRNNSHIAFSVDGKQIAVVSQNPKWKEDGESKKAEKNPIDEELRNLKKAIEMYKGKNLDQEGCEKLLRRIEAIEQLIKNASP